VQGAGYSWYGKYFQNLPNRVWYPRTGDWEAGEPQAFTTVLLPVTFGGATVTASWALAVVHKLKLIKRSPHSAGREG